MPYRIAVNGVTVECDSPQEVLSLLEFMRREKKEKKKEKEKVEESGARIAPVVERVIRLQELVREGFVSLYSYYLYRGGEVYYLDPQGKLQKRISREQLRRLAESYHECKGDFEKFREKLGNSKSYAYFVHRILTALEKKRLLPERRQRVKAYNLRKVSPTERIRMEREIMLDTISRGR